MGRLVEVAAVFLKLGTLSFGGPAAHIAMMEGEFVERRRWLERGRFLELVGAANLIPGPTSTELAIYIGFLHAGWPGLVLAGTCFILPAMAIVLGLAYGYVQYGTLPQVASVLYGIKPVIIAVIAQAVWKLARTAVTDAATATVGVLALALSLAAVNPLAVLAVSGLLLAGYRRRSFFGLPAVAWPLLGSAATGGEVAAGKMGLATLFAVFFKIGSILYSSGYVLLAFLWADFVDGYRVMTAQQLLDAVAVGQFTPGPVFTTATFIGYLVAGLPGAITATVAIFLPSFVFVPLINILMERIRRSATLSAFLAGVVVASLALMAAVAWTLAAASLVDWLTAAAAGLSLTAIARYRVNTTWLIVAGGLAGLAKLVLAG